MSTHWTSVTPGMLLCRKQGKGTLGWVLEIVSAIFWISHLSGANAAVPQTTFDWKKINPSENLTWVDCYTGRECARLQVPLDYSNPTGDKAAVALLRIKAKVSPDSKEYRGPILFNPGGPGESGVSQVLESGEDLQEMLGKEFDMLGFDPRGVGQTEPVVSVFTDIAERAAWDAGAPPLLNSTPDALPRAFARAHVFNELIEARSKQAAEHVSTPVVARDMLSIIKAHGSDRLQYWGKSYGSILGITYAAMFPNNIERLVIDGVQDFDDYYSGSWSENLVDSDKTLQFLYDKCASAGFTCPLHADSGTLVRKRVDAILDSIKANPMPITDDSNYAVIDLKLLREALFGSLASPFSDFPQIAQALAALEGGDGKTVLKLLTVFQPLQKCGTLPQLGVSGTEVTLAIKCGDGLGANNTLSGIMQHFKSLDEISTFADDWTDAQRTSCAGWRVVPKERFTGRLAVNTSFPIMVIGNSLDPLTPLVGAQKAAEAFGGAVLLTIDTPGHTSDAATSICAKKALRAYFVQGQLPDSGMICDTEDVLFGGEQTTSQNVSTPDTGLH